MTDTFYNWYRVTYDGDDRTVFCRHGFPDFADCPECESPYVPATLIPICGRNEPSLMALAGQQVSVLETGGTAHCGHPELEIAVGELYKATILIGCEEDVVR